MPIYALEDFIPVVKTNTYIHPSAEIIGDVIIEEHCFIGPGAVLRGDFGRIFVGHHSNIQDTCVLHSFPDKDCHLEPYWPWSNIAWVPDWRTCINWHECSGNG